MTPPIHIIIPCATCDVPMEAIVVPGNHDRSALQLLHCPRCGVQEDHRFEERLCEPASAEAAA